MKIPSFHKFYDQEKGYIPRLLDDTQLAEYLAYVDSPFTISKITYEDDKISIRKWICPKIRYNYIIWHTHVFIVATLKAADKYKHLAVYGPVMYLTDNSFDDSKYKKTLASAIFDYWGIELKK